MRRTCTVPDIFAAAHGQPFAGEIREEFCAQVWETPTDVQLTETTSAIAFAEGRSRGSSSELPTGSKTKRAHAFRISRRAALSQMRHEHP